MRREKVSTPNGYCTLEGSGRGGGNGGQVERMGWYRHRHVSTSLIAGASKGRSAGIFTVGK